MQFLSAFHHIPPFISLCQWMPFLPLYASTFLYTAKKHSSSHYSFCFLPSFLLFSPTHHFHYILPLQLFILWPSILSFPHLWLHLNRANQEIVWCVDGCLWRCLLRQVFIEIGAVFVLLANDSHSDFLSSLEGPFVLDVMYSVSWWTFDSAKMCNYWLLLVCVCACVCKMRWWEICRDTEIQFSFDSVLWLLNLNPLKVQCMSYDESIVQRTCLVVSRY